MQYVVPVVSMAVFAVVVAGVLAWVSEVMTLEGEAKVRVTNNGHVFALPLGANLMGGLGEVGYALMAQCGGGGTCATCRVRAVSGVEDPNAAMLGPISPKLQKEGWILSCQTAVANDLEIELFDALVTSWPDEITTEGAPKDAAETTPGKTLPAEVAALRDTLPGFDCEACGFPTCDDYAQAIADGKAGPDACLPGGAPVLQRLKRAAQAAGVVQLSPQAQTIRAALPGFDCEACGQPSCDALAEALAAGQADVAACSPGGAPVLEQLKSLVNN